MVWIWVGSEWRFEVLGIGVGGDSMSVLSARVVERKRARRKRSW